MTVSRQDEMVHVPVPVADVDAEEREEDFPQVGDWYWIPDEKKSIRYLACVTHVGSNHVKLEAPGGYTWRILFDDLDDYEQELHPEARIEEHIEHHRNNVNRLMGRVREITALLGVGQRKRIGDGASAETKALARLGSGTAVGEYKTALVLAKETTLPKLFGEIKDENEALARWMTAKVLPLKAQAEGLKGLVNEIDGRILNVELYAGLTEQVGVVAEGAPAPNDTPIHLMQRRCYMDEECLAEYRTGGMEFDGIHAFDRWLAEPVNRDRLLPFPRCIVAFRVRREKKERGPAYNISDFITFSNMAEADKSTFLYIRNGEQIHWLETKIDFGPKLFPDTEQDKLSGEEPLWAKMFGNRVEQIITQGHYDDLVREHAEYEAKFKTESAAWKKLSKEEQKGKSAPYYGFNRDPSHEYKPYSPDNVHYDDIKAHIGKEIEHHNRIVLILQGLLDRSQVLHPHPPWRLWIPAEFERALVLVHDESRALVAGPPPDFEAFRARLNTTLKAGCITVGQDIRWEMAEAEKENDRRHRDWRNRGRYDSPEIERYAPYGNPGPGRLAIVKTFRVGRCKYTWEKSRERRSWDKEDLVPVRFTTDAKNVLNVSAYKPGDFKQFFADPRTRADYLKWAPFLLEAEEYHAGNRKVNP